MNKYTFTIPAKDLPEIALEGLRPGHWSPWERTESGWKGDQVRRALCKGAPLAMTYDGQNLIFVLDDPEGQEGQKEYDAYLCRVLKKRGDMRQGVIANIAEIK
jgi:hypothetical protein